MVDDRSAFATSQPTHAAGATVAERPLSSTSNWHSRPNSDIHALEQVALKPPVRRKIIAAIVERTVIEKILSHLGLDPQPPPNGRAREAGQD